MSLTKLLMAPIKLFKKQVITFLIIRRHDLGLSNDILSYIAVRPSASIFALRQKVWHLLNLPDYCEEVIILKSPGNVEIALTELRRGNDPQHPYLLEVWNPGSRDCGKLSTSDTCGDSAATTVFNNMLTYKHDDRDSSYAPSSIFEEVKEGHDKLSNDSQSALLNQTKTLHKMPIQNDFSSADFKKSEISCRLSRSSLFRTSGRKSQDNFTNLLLKIQSDLSNLSTKLTVLENKIIS